MQKFDVVIIGAGAAGLFCAGIAGQLGQRVLLIDHAEKVAEKIRISGGGRSNFTNRDAGPANFLSENPHFCRSALARYTPQDFIALVQRHRIPFHEKHKGQLFCDESSEDLIAMLLRECEQGQVQRWQPCTVHAVRHTAAGFELDSSRGVVQARRVVVATGGLSIPKIGASDFGHRLARQFGHRLVEPRPALVPLTFSTETWAPYAALSGLSLEVRIATGTGKARSEFLEDLLFTHRGLSGPAVLQISSFWRPGQPLQLDLTPQLELAGRLRAAKAGSRKHLGNELHGLLPARLADAWLAGTPELAARPVAEVKDKDLDALAQRLQRWELLPAGTEGYRKAEVTAGGVDTRELNSQNMESRRLPGLYFIGEVVDVTGWLGGYNFQWAWASAAACARAMAAAGSAVAGRPVAAQAVLQRDTH
ncbi:NAD(P)/FAD-dependent oxidoreductase [Aquabacterium sp. A7-Y]|uniref:NAD(P)/FAD-dependent oxidoreductase n=1 Tax=Aquabacterium sp. A7-Y TaxID=1349605 RepID=UPI00223CDE07|nr:NAD(P)/FAD-dependent oxidoreductase [Aquabacterium sp. A7-Y]MCW7537577.1 NAD(P)/FAD-dependent oxidoreductase [Aquabacterium sp. A7-Y]